MPTQVFTQRYQIVRKVARGGMAEVFLAKDLLLERPVALKVLFPEFSSDRSFVERFRREARAAANLNHANIVSIFDWGEEDGTYFIVMEFVDGDTLRQLINTEGPLPVVQAAAIGADVAGALHFAHLSGVIHRDVKPGNVLISGGRVKVTDFGIARRGDPAESLTQTGAVMGTATYFSPEQAQGHIVDPRSDVYSLGVVLYEMVAKRPPFAGDSPLSIAYQHVREEPTPPSAYNPDIPPLFDDLILRAMAKHPDDRPSSADELRDELLDFTEGRVSHSRSQPAIVPPPLGGETTTFSPAVENGLDGTRVVPRGPAPPGGRRPPPKNRTGAYIAVLAILLSVLAALLFLLSRELGGGDAQGQVSVPSTIDKTEAEARRQIEAAGLRARSEPADGGQPGRVVSQDPGAGRRVARNSEVILRVGRQAEIVDVPDVRNTQADAADARLTAAGFLVEIEREPSAAVARDLVLRQSPAAAAKAAVGSVVTLTVSDGPAEVRVPEVRNREATEAANALGQVGLLVSSKRESSALVAEGRAIRTDPAVGSFLATGSRVTLFISSGPELAASTTTTAAVTTTSASGPTTTTTTTTPTTSTTATTDPKKK